MTNTDAWKIIEKWAAENMPVKKCNKNGPDLGRILSSAGANATEFSKFMPRKKTK